MVIPTSPPQAEEIYRVGEEKSEKIKKMEKIRQKHEK